MLSLHWILALTLVFVHCLVAKPFGYQATNQQLLHDINGLQNHTCTEKGSTYSFSDLPHKDAKVALHCQIQNLKDICKKCFNNQIDPFQKCRRIGDTIARHQQYTLPHPQAATIMCENKTKTFDEFLVELNTLLYKVHSS